MIMTAYSMMHDILFKATQFYDINSYSMSSYTSYELPMPKYAGYTIRNNRAVLL